MTHGAARAHLPGIPPRPGEPGWPGTPGIPGTPRDAGPPVHRAAGRPLAGSGTAGPGLDRPQRRLAGHAVRAAAGQADRARLRPAGRRGRRAAVGPAAHPGRRGGGAGPPGTAELPVRPACRPHRDGHPRRPARPGARLRERRDQRICPGHPGLLPAPDRLPERHLHPGRAQARSRRDRHRRHRAPAAADPHARHAVLQAGRGHRPRGGRDPRGCPPPPFADHGPGHRLRPHPGPGDNPSPALRHSYGCARARAEAARRKAASAAGLSSMCQS